MCTLFWCIYKYLIKNRTKSRIYLTTIKCTRPLYLHITDNILAKKSSIYRENIALLSHNHTIYTTHLKAPYNISYSEFIRILLKLRFLFINK